MSEILVERDGRVATLTMNRPAQRNAIDPAMKAALVRELRALDDDDLVRVVVLTGAGDRAFCTGADLGSSFVRADDPLATHESRALLRDLYDVLAALRTPVVARTNGPAHAGGFGVLLACDLVVAVETATFSLPEVRRGLWPFILSRQLRDHLGPKRALDLMMTGRRLTAAEALDWGLVNRVVPATELDLAVDAMVGDLLQGAPGAMALGRRSFYDSRGMRHEDAYRYLHGMLDLAVQTGEVEEGVAAFREKRTPSWALDGQDR